MRNVFTRGRVGALAAVVGLAGFGPGCGMMDKCKDGSCEAKSSTKYPAGDAVIPTATPPAMPAAPSVTSGAPATESKGMTGLMGR